MRRRVAPLAAALWLSACQTLPTPAELPGRPADPGDPRWRALVLDWNERARERESLRGGAELALDSDAAGVHLRSRQRFALERPERLRVEVQGFLDQSLALLCIDAGHYQLFRAEDRSTEEGPVREGLLFEQALLDLSPAEAIELLLGSPLLDPTLSVVAAWQLPGGGARLDLADDRGVLRERPEFDAAGQLVALAERDELGAPEWRVRFSEFRDVAGELLPHRIELDAGSPPSHAEIALRDLELDPALPEDLFRLPASLRAGARPR